LFLLFWSCRAAADSDAVIAIDFGSSFSCVAVLHAGVPLVLRVAADSTQLPSIVAFGPAADDDVLVGHDASDALAFGTVNPANVVIDVKRLLGRSLADAAAATNAQQIAYKLVDSDSDSDSDSGVAVELLLDGQPRRVSPEAIAALLIGKLKRIAETHLRHSVSRAVTAVPTHFDDAQRAAVRRAFRLAGLDLVDMLDESLAIAAATDAIDGGDGRRDAGDVLVVHWGGATFATALLQRHADGSTHVRRAAHDESLGGAEFDRCLARLFVQHSSLRLRRECARAKHALAVRNATTVEFGDAAVPVARVDFEETCDALFVRAVALLEPLCAGVEPQRVVLAGGSTRLRRVRELTSSRFTFSRIRQLLYPDESVVRGLALRCTDAGAHPSSPLTLPIGVAIGGGWMAEVTPSGATLPVARLVSPTGDGALRFYRGESARCADNEPFGDALQSEHAADDEIAVLVTPSGVQLGGAADHSEL
jgi:molecular chaperone DnaK (HSP70)